MSRPSYVCLSSVTFVRPTQKVELFGNILHHLTAWGLEQLVLKFWEKTNFEFRLQRGVNSLQCVPWAAG